MIERNQKGKFVSVRGHARHGTRGVRPHVRRQIQKVVHELECLRDREDELQEELFDIGWGEPVPFSESAEKKMADIRQRMEKTRIEIIETEHKKKRIEANQNCPECPEDKVAPECETGACPMAAAPAETTTPSEGR